jgi:hypothetical protein
MRTRHGCCCTPTQKNTDPCPPHSWPWQRDGVQGLKPPLALNPWPELLGPKPQLALTQEEPFLRACALECRPHHACATSGCHVARAYLASSHLFVCAHPMRRRYQASHPHQSHHITPTGPKPHQAQNHARPKTNRTPGAQTRQCML